MVTETTSSGRNAMSSGTSSKEEEEDPEFVGSGASKKKKHAYRREVQKRYRQRLKQKLIDTEAAVEETSLHIAKLRDTNRSLFDVQVMLGMLEAEANRIAEFLAKHEASFVLHTEPLAPSTDPLIRAECMMELAFNGKKDVKEEVILEYASFPISILAKKETDFMDRLDSMLQEWNVRVSSRETIERRMTTALDSRRRAAVIMSSISPEQHFILMKNVQPAPGTPAGDAARKLLLQTMEGLEMTDDQIECIRKAYINYKDDLACIHAELALAQLGLHVLPGTSDCTGNGSSGGCVGMGMQAHGLLTALESANIMRRVPHRMHQAYACLAAAVQCLLSVVQTAKLLLGCRPYLPDHVQFCELIESGEYQRNMVSSGSIVELD